MSGPKEADVRLKLQRLLECVQWQQAAAASNSACYQQLGLAETEASRRAAQNLRNAASGLSAPEVRRFAATEAAALAAAASETQRLVEQGERAYAEAEQMRNEALQLRQQSDECLRQATALGNQAAQGVDQGGFLKQIVGFQDEDQRASYAQQLAQQSLQYERQVAGKLQAAADRLRAAHNAYDQACAQGRHIKGEARRIAELAAEQSRAAEIAETQCREATAARQEATSLTARLEQLDHARFAPGEYDRLRPELTRLQSAFQASEHATVTKIAAACLPGLRTLAENVASRQTAWESARAAAANDLQSAQQELQALDREALLRWSGDAPAVQQAYDQLAAAQQKFDGEAFAEAQQLIAPARQSLRTLHGRAADHQAKGQQRELISEAIMNALYEQGYDAPTFYYGDKDAAGQDNVLSDLTIFAKAPGNAGDMRMKVDLNGHVDLDVEGIAEGDEGRCVSLLQDLQKQLAGEVDFRMTNWGRAAGAQPDRPVAVQVQQQVQEKTKERERG